MRGAGYGGEERRGHGMSCRHAKERSAAQAVKRGISAPHGGAGCGASCGERLPQERYPLVVAGEAAHERSLRECGHRMRSLK